MKIKEIKKRLTLLYDDLRHEISSSAMDIVMELVELEILLEQESNK
jgi:hypothetical protein